MKKYIVSILLATALIACSKDKFKTEPQAEIKSLGPDEVRKGEVFSFSATVRDKEGDIQDSVFIVRKRFTGTTLLQVDTVKYNIKPLNVPIKTQMEVNVLFGYGELIPGTIFQNLENVDRNFAVGIIVKDKAGNRSEYVESDMIVLKKL